MGEVVAFHGARLSDGLKHSDPTAVASANEDRPAPRQVGTAGTANCKVRHESVRLFALVCKMCGTSQLMQLGSSRRIAGSLKQIRHLKSLGDEEAQRPGREAGQR